MRISLTKLRRIASPFLVAAMALLVGCEDAAVDNNDEPNTETPDGADYIVVSNITPTFNNVSFDINAESAVSISYACALATADEMDAARVMEAGVNQGVNQGSYTISSLKSETEYKLYAVAQIPSVGVVGPVVSSFTTSENVGEPSSTTSAGIRAVDVGTSSSTNISWAVINGDEVDFSLSMVQPTIIMDNLLYEMAKTGVSKEEYLQYFMTYYEYLQATTEGRGATATFNYTDVYTTTPIIPGADYTIYSLAFSGDYDTYADGGSDGIVMLEMTEAPLSTAEIALIGAPSVTLETTECGYIHFTHKVTPNADAAYWASYFTLTEEFQEFRDYYDTLEGAGQGDERLKEYIVHADADYIVDLTTGEPQTGTVEWSTTLGWDMDGIDFSRVAIGLDKNLVASNEYEETIDQLIAQDNSTPADFDVTVSHEGAGSFFIRCRLGENCRQVYWRMEATGYFDAYLEDEQLSADLGRLLWDEGWAFHRNYFPSTDYDETTGKYVERAYEEFHYGEALNTTFDLVAVGLNTSGGISTPIKVATFTTCDYTYTGAFDPYITITIPQEEVSKTAATAYYEVDDFEEFSDEHYYNNREFYHVMLLSSDAIATSDEQTQAEYLYTEGNCWPNVYSDGTSMSWPSLESSTDYTYLYASVNEDGEVGRVKALTFSTPSNDGGLNPEFSFSINEEDVIENISDSSLYGLSYLVTPSADVRGFYHLIFSENTLESWSVPTNSKDDLEYFFKDQITTQGLPATDVAYNSEYNTPKGKRIWVVADGFGSEDSNKMLSYVEVYMDTNGNVTIEDQVDVKYTDESAVSTTVSAYTNCVLKASINTVSRQREAQNIEKPAIEYFATPLKKLASDSSAETIREKTGLPVYSFKEMSLRTLLRGGEQK